MTGIFSKARTIFLSNVHSVLDAAINLNDVGAVEQHCRDLQDARRDLEGQLAESRYDLTNIERNLHAHEAHDAELVANIRTLVTVQKQQAAKALTVELQSLRTQIETEKLELNDKQTRVANLEDVVAKVNAQEKQMIGQLGKLRAVKATASANTKAAAAIEAASSAVAAGGNVDNLVDKIGREGAVANARLDRAMGELNTNPSIASADASAEALLASLTSDITAPKQPA
jgi:phage shock protein A